MSRRSSLQTSNIFLKNMAEMRSGIIRAYTSVFRNQSNASKFENDGSPKDALKVYSQAKQFKPTHRR